MHLAAHADLTRDIGVETVVKIENGALVRLAPGPAEVVDQIEAGRLYRDGAVIGGMDDIGVAQRRRLAFAGHVAVAIVIDQQGALRAEPDAALLGLPAETSAGEAMDDVVIEAVIGAVESIPRRRRRDPELVEKSARRAVRAAVAAAWGKKPDCSVLVTVV